MLEMSAGYVNHKFIGEKETRNEKCGKKENNDYHDVADYSAMERIARQANPKRVCKAQWTN